MTDPQTSQAGGTSSTLVIPDELKAKFPELIELILVSESMNDSERQYWMNILPVMTPDQVQNLTDILQNERKQLSAIDEKYATIVSSARATDEIAAERRVKADERKQQEESAKEHEDKATEDILSQIESH